MILAPEVAPTALSNGLPILICFHSNGVLDAYHRAVIEIEITYWPKYVFYIITLIVGQSSVIAIKGQDL